MNAKPHTHEVEIRNRTYYTIHYGDTQKRLWRFFSNKPSLRRVEKAIRKIVREHDQGSVAAEIRQNEIDKFKALYLSEDNRPLKEWGTEILARSK